MYQIEEKCKVSIASKVLIMKSQGLNSHLLGSSSLYVGRHQSSLLFTEDDGCIAVKMCAFLTPLTNVTKNISYYQVWYIGLFCVLTAKIY